MDEGKTKKNWQPIYEIKFITDLDMRRYFSVINYTRKKIHR
jgi:hypothetical protein